MSDNHKQQPQKQEAETKSATEKKKKSQKKRRKCSKINGVVDNRELKELSDVDGDSTVVDVDRRIYIAMEQLKEFNKWTSVSRKAAGCFWIAALTANQQVRPETLAAKAEENRLENVVLTKSARRRQKLREAEKKYVAMDCEMVGVGVNGQDNMLARVSIVSKRGEVLLDKFVKPQEPVIDYRTSVSGIRPHNISNAEDFKSVQKEVVQILKDKILVGHAICGDLSVLNIKHPRKNIRDTSRYKPLRRMVAIGYTPSLKRLSQVILHKEIQTGEHNSVEDARAAMSIYNIFAKDWEAHIKRHQQKIGK